MINLEEYLDRKEFKRRIVQENEECMMLKLPNELLSFVFLNYLNLNDQIRLSKVCKRFYSIMQNKSNNKLNELAIFLNQYATPEKMYFTKQTINYSNTVCLSSIYCLFVDEFKIKFKDIEHLLIVNNLDDELQSTKIDFNDNILNCFKRLKHLEIRDIQQLKGNCDLPELQTFYVSTRSQSTFTISSSNLTKLGYFDKARPTILHTKKLTTLAAQQLVSPFLGYGFLNKKSDCLNLKKLIAYEAYQIKWVINKYRGQLDEIKCINQLKVREIKDLKRTIDELKLIELNLFYYDINVRSASFSKLLNRLCDEWIFFIETLDAEFVRIFANNPIDLQDSIKYVKEISLDESIKLNDDLDDFISKLTNLQVLNIQSTDNQLKLNSSVLIKFTNSSTKLIKLNLESIEIYQLHMDLMPSKFQLLNELRIADCTLNNLDFINQFKFLTTFTTNCDLNVKQTTKLLLKSPVRIVFC